MPNACCIAIQSDWTKRVNMSLTFTEYIDFELLSKEGVVLRPDTDRLQLDELNSLFHYYLQNVHIHCSSGSFGPWWRPTSIFNLSKVGAISLTIFHHNSNVMEILFDLNQILIKLVGLGLFNDDICPSGHISRPTQVNVSQELLSFSKKLSYTGKCVSELLSFFNNYSSLLILSMSGG